MPESIAILDLRGYECPLPVLKVRSHLRKIETGTSVWVRTDDALAVIDIPNFCAEFGQVLIEHKPGDSGEADHWFLIERQGELR